MANDARGRARGGTNREANVRLATPRRGVGVEREAVAAESVSFPVIVAIVHLAIVQAVASLVHTRGTFNPGADLPSGLVPGSLSGITDTIVGPMSQGDALWYRLIADRGYDAQPMSAAFWPLFPWLMSVGGAVTGLAPETIGYAIANLSFVGALVLLYRLISFDFDREIARRALVAIALCPFAFVFSAVYAEALFLLLAVAALYAARQEQWVAAGLYGLLAALSHWQGALLVVPFAILVVRHYGVDPRRLLPNLPAVLLPLFGPVIFAWQLSRAGYDWLAYYDVQRAWDRDLTAPWTTIQNAWTAADWGWMSALLDDPTWSTLTSSGFRADVGTSGTPELITLAAVLAIVAIGFWVLPLYQTAMMLPALAIPLIMPAQDQPLLQFPRYALVLIPLFVVAALLLRDRRTALPVAALSIMLLVIFTTQFAQGYWVP